MDYTYNKELHTAIPTNDTVRFLTGFDLILEEGNKEKADGKIVSLTLKARDYLYSQRTQGAQKVLTYLIYSNQDYRNDFLRYVVAYIETSLLATTDFIYGDVVPNAIKQAINGSRLSATRFNQSLYSEATNSTEDF